jgi:hypothetical protein
MAKILTYENGKSMRNHETAGENFPNRWASIAHQPNFFLKLNTIMQTYTTLLIKQQR